MSLCCVETGETISTAFFGGVEFVITREDSPKFSVISKAVLDKIPNNKKLKKPRTDKKGLDIHKGGGTSLLAQNLSMGDFLFSIDHKTALKHIPNAYIKEYPPIK